MLDGMARPAFDSVVFSWLCATVAAFVALFEFDATDDFAGWLPVMVSVQAPAFLALRRGGPAGGDDRDDPGSTARSEAPLRGARRWALALPAALAASMAMFWVGLAIGNRVWKPQFLELRPLFLGAVAGLVALITAGVAFARVLWQLPHPRGARGVLLAVAILGAIGLAAMAVSFGQSRRHLDPGAWLVVAVPILWVIPLWILTPLAPRREPAIPRAAVSR